MHILRNTQDLASSHFAHTFCVRNQTVVFRSNPATMKISNSNRFSGLIVCLLLGVVLGTMVGPPDPIPGEPNADMKPLGDGLTNAPEPPSPAPVSPTEAPIYTYTSTPYLYTAAPYTYSYEFPGPPTAAPTDDCFSGNTMVEMQGKGRVPIETVEVGDFIRANGNDGEEAEYSRVIFLGKHRPESVGRYVQLFVTEHQEDGAPIEMTENHMLFLQGSDKGVRAADVRVGDILKGGRQVVKVGKVAAKGVFAPVTENGYIQINGVVCSSYCAMYKYSWFNQHAAVHAFLKAYRRGWFPSFEGGDRGPLQTLLFSVLNMIREHANPATQYFLSFFAMPICHLFGLCADVILYGKEIMVLLFLGAVAYSSDTIVKRIKKFSSGSKMKKAKMF